MGGVPERRCLGAGGLQRFGAARAERDGGSAGGEREGDGAPDAAAGAAYDDPATGKIKGHAWYSPMKREHDSRPPGRMAQEVRLS
jgi:hypothetical protein